MECKIDITAETDLAAWVTKDAFFANVDPSDLACRESMEVFDWYHPEWFRPADNGKIHFTPPAFEFRNGHLLGINGRHRAVLLFRHMGAIPMLLVMAHTWPKDKLGEIRLKEIEEGETVELPDLPINKDLIAVDDSAINQKQRTQPPLIKIIFD